MTADTDESLTLAQRWAREARRLVNEPTLTGYEQVLDAEFEQESRRTVTFLYNRQQVLGSIDTMRRMGLHVDGDDVAVAGQHHLLTARHYEHRRGKTEVLAVTAWTESGRLRRMIEFDEDGMEDALAELETLAATAPVILIER